MSAPMFSSLKRVVPSNFLSNKFILHGSQYPCRTAFFWQKKKEEKVPTEIRKPLTKIDGPTTVDRLQSLKKQTSVCTVRGYKPPTDLLERMERITCELCGDVGDWTAVSLGDDRRLKFKLLTRFIKEFDHDIPSCELHDMHSVGDAITFFTTEVRDTSTYEDLSKLDLPKNLHIQLKHLSFDPETDTMFGGVSAFDQKTLKSRSRFRESDS
ncbi:39S ribosomal protein L50, mitochondrial-like [Gigantopelta aegis]|uniref:39S ribosomal protein L50, mitochondrial-like n=1 Tax=Gigantopelta aegis TaxID=1735272 RepID=UPI001B88CECC|nr:39S ribosomal protein L50, mitochondrial-like [Gigantopelta aegis]